MGTVSLNLSAFRAISSGDHNMGDVRITSNGKLEALNRFVFRQGRNNDYISVQENIEVRKAFMKALKGDPRADAGMIEAFQDVLLGSNAVKTLTRDEIAACFKALDRRDVSNLAETIDGLEHRNAQADRPLASVTSSRSVARQLSVNERQDAARCCSQQAAGFFAKMTLAAARGDDEAAQSAFESFKFELARTLMSAVASDLLTMQGRVEAAFGDFDPCGDSGDFRQALEAPLKALRKLEGGAVDGAVADLLETAVLRSPGSLAPSLVETLAAEISEADYGGVELPQALCDILARQRPDPDEPSTPNLPQPIEKPAGRQDLDDVEFVRGLCDELMSRQPSVAHDECCQTVEWCDRILATLEGTKKTRPEAAAELDGQIERVQSRKAAEIRHRDNNPLSYRTVLMYFSKVIHAAEDVYREQVGEGETRKDCLNELRLDLGFLDDVTDCNADCPNAGAIVGKARDLIVGRLKTVFAVHGLKIDHVHAKLAKAFNLRLCTEPWEPLVGEFLAVLPSLGRGRPSESVKVKDVISPFRHIEGFQDNVTYENGINGVSCRMVKSKHATSAMNSQFFYNGLKIFNGVRTGVLCAVGVAQEDLEEAAASRAREAVIAAILANDGVMGELNGDSEAVPEMLLTSTALLTPDFYRGAVRSLDSDKNEKEMLKYQWQALNDLNGRKIKVEVNGVTREVKVNILSFNFGVNKYAVGWRSPVSGGWDGEIDLKTGSETVRDHNRANVDLLETHVGKAYERLDREIAAALGKNPPDLGTAAELQKRKDKIYLLMRQLRSVVDSKNEGSLREDSYKVGARINMISFLIGGTPQWNCKSGKDRTGQLDVETKFLALLLATDRRIPEPGERLSPEYSALLATIALESGNHEVQVLSSGLPGFKVDSSTVEERLPDDGDFKRRYAAFKHQIGA